MHDQLNHENYRLGKVELRQLLDLAMVRARHGNAIDWTELDRRFGSVGSGPVLATYLQFAEVLLGQAAPPALSHGPRSRAMADFRRDIDWPAMRALAQLRISIDYIAGPARRSGSHPEKTFQSANLVRRVRTDQGRDPQGEMVIKAMQARQLSSRETSWHSRR